MMPTLQMMNGTATVEGESNFSLVANHSQDNESSTRMAKIKAAIQHRRSLDSTDGLMDEATALYTNLTPCEN